MYKCLFGIEFETTYNDDFFNPPINDYHHGEPGEWSNKWWAESDGSLEMDDDIYCCSAEFITIPFKFKEWSKVFNDFKDKVNRPFNEVFRINNTCGCHIHFSLNKGKYAHFPMGEDYHKYFIILRNRFFNRLRQKYPRLYPQIRHQYNRDYAQVTYEPTDLHHRENEFNFITPSKGIEWRSFNLQGVTTWDEFKGVVQIALEEIERIVLDMQKTKFIVQQRLVLGDSKYKPTFSNKTRFHEITIETR